MVGCSQTKERRNRHGILSDHRQGKALHNVTMRVPKGAIYGFVGKNGAGKTTLIRLICGLQAPTAGGYTLYGVRNTDPSIHRVRRRMGAVVESPAIYLDLTAEDNLRLQARLLGLPSEEGIAPLLELVGLGETGRKKARNFSLGMRQRLGIAVALCGEPDFLVLDEPVNGLDPQGIIEMRELILKLNREYQITVLLSSHILDELARLATHYGFLDQGTLVREVSAQELEAACRRCVRLTVTDAKTLCRVLDGRGLEYRLAGEGEADVYEAHDLSQLILDLHQAGCQVTGLHQRDETLESYYMNLVGGGRDV